jgi:hypothetical protein
MPFAVIVPFGVMPGVAFAVGVDGAHGPMRIGKLPLHFSQFLDEIDAVHAASCIFVASLQSSTG